MIADGRPHRQPPQRMSMSDGSWPIRAWLELDLEAHPIQGTLSRPGGAPNPFVGWLGLTAALEGLSSLPEPAGPDSDG